MSKNEPKAPKPAPRNAAEELAEIHGRLVVVNRRLGKLQVERAELIARRNELEAAGA